jgi:transcriptional regulator with XRE-family HTH domain
MSTKDIADRCGLPSETVRSIIGGKTPDPRLSTVTSIVNALDGSLDEIGEGIKPEEQNMSESVIELYEQRLKDKDERIKAVIRDKRIYMITVGVLVLILIGFFVVDILIGSEGWIVYK